MKKTNLQGWAWLVSLAAILVGAAQASSLQASSFDGDYSTCGGDVPWPFQVSNQTAELADGERYLLLGHIEIVRDRVFFVVDLNKHNWLASAKRRRSPKYLLTGEQGYWAEYVGKRIRVTARARWQIVETARGGQKVEVTLESLADPAVARLRGNQPR